MAYVSTNQDRRLAILLGGIYIALAIVLAYMLFVIWPTVPWPTPDKLAENPEARFELEKAAGDCGCNPTPTPTPTPLPAANQTTNPTSGGNQGAARPATPAGIQPGGQTANPPASQTNAQPVSPAEPAKSTEPAAKSTPSSGKSILPLRLPLKILRWCICTTFDERLLLLVIISGMLGAFVHGATSLADYIGNNNFNKNWTWFYLLRPVIGMALALVFYFVIRGGFLTTSGGAGDINPYGIAALAGLVGMFSKQATDKLSEVFTTLFKSSEGGDQKRSGSLEGDKVVTVGNVEPPKITAGSTGQTIAVSGTNFVTGARVLANDLPQETKFVSETQLTAQLQDELVAQPGTLKLKVLNPDNTESEPRDFPVVAGS